MNCTKQGRKARKKEGHHEEQKRILAGGIIQAVGHDWARIFPHTSVLHDNRKCVTSYFRWVSDLVITEFWEQNITNYIYSCSDDDGQSVAHMRSKLFFSSRPEVRDVTQGRTFDQVFAGNGEHNIPNLYIFLLGRQWESVSDIYIAFFMTTGSEWRHRSS